MDRVRAALDLGELVGRTLTDFDIQENEGGLLELRFEDVCVRVRSFASFGTDFDVVLGVEVC